jgi:hypothetical protein
MTHQPDNFLDKLSGLGLPLEGAARVATVIPTKCRDTWLCAPERGKSRQISRQNGVIPGAAQRSMRDSCRFGPEFI